ncbi:receptor-interacting serine/threonine-protein kinase 3 [Cheilinus undulatus]|uniref:receptor-interacting serine/threonine-protein kinase 3 n=1 Tax=Cheilinus undulatus TaxID=241271 RepID=UPI001BD2D3C4|nr:receptor-interacting serine/threonine-protein kinase 3 [Cheilinus undulatus]
MALSSCPPTRFIEASSLEDWVELDSGGFGHVYKARHRRWCSNVAVKLLRFHDSKAVLREIDMMSRGRSPHVIQVLGVFKGQLPFRPSSIQLGLVMELMDRGSLAFLQKTLPGFLPWPLVFRLAHQVALGINFLHSLSPPMLHLDLKPSNVLLDPSLNAKLTDFGLSRFYHSNTRLSSKDTEQEGGTLPYMPPEAFDVSYKPTCASDIYSYGILLWSIVTWKKPYENVTSSIVRLLIPDGQRPSLDEIRRFSGLAGLEGLMALMEKCWEGNHKLRPSSYECTTVTEDLFKMHKREIVDVVHQVLKKLSQQEEEGEVIKQLYFTEASVRSRVKASLYDSVPTGHPPVQEMAGGSISNQRHVPRFKDSPSRQPASVSEVDTGRSFMDHNMKKSSVYPILSPQPSPTTMHPTHRRTRSLLSQYFHQCSIPSLFCYPTPPPPEFHIKMSNATGIQYGSNNTMHINTTAPQATDPQGRRRHPTAPSSVNSLPTEPRSRWDGIGS